MKVIFSKKAEKELSKLDKSAQKKIRDYVFELQKLEDPRSRGKVLVGNLSGFWRYRVMDYRLICKIEDDKLIITIVSVAHRRKVYTKKK